MLQLAEACAASYQGTALGMKGPAALDSRNDFSPRGRTIYSLECQRAGIKYSKGGHDPCRLLARFSTSPSYKKACLKQFEGKRCEAIALRAAPGSSSSSQRHEGQEQRFSEGCQPCFGY